MGDPRATCRCPGPAGRPGGAPPEGPRRRRPASAPHAEQRRGTVALQDQALSGVTIGDGAVVGTKAVVAKDVRPYAIVDAFIAQFDPGP